MSSDDEDQPLSSFLTGTTLVQSTPAESNQITTSASDKIESKDVSSKTPSESNGTATTNRSRKRQASAQKRKKFIESESENSDSEFDKESQHDEESDYDEDSDVPMMKAAKSKKSASKAKSPRKVAKSSAIVESSDEEDSKESATKTKAPRKAAKSSAIVESSDEDDFKEKPKTVKKPTEKKETGNKAVKKEVKAEDEDSDDSDAPLSSVVKKEKNPAAAKPVKKKVKQEAEPGEVDDDSDAPLSSVVKKTEVKNEDKPSSSKRKRSETEAVKAETKAKRGKKEEVKTEKKGKGKKVKEEEEEEEDENSKWWRRLGEEDNGIKWTTLHHIGPLFAPPYKPHGVRMKYDGKLIDLEPAAEEVATFWAELINTDHAKKETFRKNFFNDFLKVCKEQTIPCPIEEFDKCDFSPIVEWAQEQRDKKKAMTKEEKELAKKERKEIEDKYGWAILDGRKEKIGTYRIEPPGLFRGRGEHPKTGMLKSRVLPEQITINISEDCPVPPAPDGHQWKEVIHDNSVTWLATWKENVNGNTKYVFLAADSSLKGKSDYEKFAKAQELKKCVGRIRTEYTKNLRDKDMQIRQRATALYLIDRFALRAGNEKGDDEADTVGCCSLRLEHITLEEGNKVIFDFLGKDSIRYYNEVVVDEQVFKNLKIFKKPPKLDEDPIFDRMSTSSLNSHLNSLMKGLTAKVFRTYNASFTFQEELKKTPEDASDKEKLLAYNRANRRVAELCNHQRSVPKTHGDQINRIRDKIRGSKVKRMEIKKQLLELDPKLKKKRPELTEPESDVDDDFVERYNQEQEEKEREALEKKLIKANEKRKEAGEKPYKSVMDLPAPKKIAPTIEKLEKQLEKINETIKNQKLSLLDKDEGKEVSLTTSKINYIDPRISVAWAKKHDIAIEKLFNASLMKKFKWAIESADEDYEF